MTELMGLRLKMTPSAQPKAAAVRTQKRICEMSMQERNARGAGTGHAKRDGAAKILPLFGGRDAGKGRKLEDVFLRKHERDMSVQQMQEEAYRIIGSLDEQSLLKFLAQFGDPEKVFVPGEPGVTVAQYNREIDEAMARMDAGGGIPHEEVVAEMEKEFGFKRAH